MLSLSMVGENGEEEEQIVPLVDGQDGSQSQNLKSGDVLAVLPLRNMVLFPGVLLPVTLSRPKSMKLVEKAYKDELIIGVFNQKNTEVKEPQAQDIYPIGTAARVLRIFDVPDGSMMAILEGMQRIWMEEYTALRPQRMVRVKVAPEKMPSKRDKNFIALATTIKEQATFILDRATNLPQEAKMMLRGINSPDILINYICVNFNMTIEEKQKLLLVDDMRLRGEMLLEFLVRQVEMVKTQADIQEKAEVKINKEQREYYLHHQLEAIQKELGDTENERVKALKERAEKKNWPQHAKAAFDEMIKKMERESHHSPDYQMDVTYLETMLDLPWNECTVDNYDIRKAKDVLDKDHYGMEKVKERIIEYLAVLKQTQAAKNKDTKAPILCLYGPPGVGKTSLGKSIATALGRKYARVSLGGLHDEAEIRGHRRTYIGAMPGRIISNIKKVQSSNPVFVLDEIDKIGVDYKGDPTSALLEVLDPEQNSTFHDNYLDVDYDLSKVLFVATANSLESIPRPLLDRMELIEMTGYLQEEKEEIAKRHLVPKCLNNNGLKAADLKISKRVMGEIIDHYTRESGVRSLERQISTICRKVVTKIALEEEYNRSLTKEDVEAYLGKPRFNRDMWENNNYYGVVTGLAWTSVGGEILFIETSLSKSKTPALTLTGNLGDVMKESAKIALGYIKAHAEHFGIAQKDLETMSVHLHVPEGAIPKDGPSAGITMTTAMVSAFTRRKVRPRIAMTGEMTLRGKVLPIGGVKEKILAAKRSGITDIVLCEDNRKDVEEIPEMYVQGLTFHYVKDIDEVINFSLLKK
ncbi:MAG: endopeptidase La [Paludibacteraceae bacterium]|nr:endopeptidase La [Paludibacteraceae bacterium]